MVGLGRIKSGFVMKSEFKPLTEEGRRRGAKRQLAAAQTYGDRLDEHIDEHAAHLSAYPAHCV